MMVAASIGDHGADHWASGAFNGVQGPHHGTPNYGDGAPRVLSHRSMRDCPTVRGPGLARRILAQVLVG